MSKDLKNRDRSKKHQMQSESSYFDKEEKNIKNRDENSDSSDDDYKKKREGRKRDKSRKESYLDSDSEENSKATSKNRKQGYHAKENSGSKKRDVKNHNSKSRSKYIEEKVRDSSSNSQNTSKSREKSIKSGKPQIPSSPGKKNLRDGKDQHGRNPINILEENKSNHSSDSNENSEEELKDINIEDQDINIPTGQKKTGNKDQFGKEFKKNEHTGDVNNKSNIEKSTKNINDTNLTIGTVKSGSPENKQQNVDQPPGEAIKLPKFSMRKPKKSKHRNSSSDSESPFRIFTCNMVEVECVSAASKDTSKPIKKRRDDSDEEEIITQNKKKRNSDGWYSTDIPPKFIETFKKTILFTQLLNLQNFEDRDIQQINSAFQIKAEKINELNNTICRYSIDDPKIIDDKVMKNI